MKLHSNYAIFPGEVLAVVELKLHGLSLVVTCVCELAFVGGVVLPSFSNVAFVAAFVLCCIVVWVTGSPNGSEAVFVSILRGFWARGAWGLEEWWFMR